MATFAFNPVTGKLDLVGEGSGPPVDNITLNADVGGSISGKTFNVLGQKSGTVPVMGTRNAGGNTFIENRTWQTQYVVDPSATDGKKGTYTTIQAAINAAIANGDSSVSKFATIALRNVVASGYVENITIPSTRIQIISQNKSTIRGSQGALINGLITVSTGGTLLMDGVGVFNSGNNSFANSGTIFLSNCNCVNVGNNVGSSIIIANNCSLTDINITTGFFEAYNCDLNASTENSLANSQFYFSNCICSSSRVEFNLSGTSTGTFENCEKLTIFGNTSGNIRLSNITIFEEISLIGATVFYNNVSLCLTSNAKEIFLNFPNFRLASTFGNVARNREVTVSSSVTQNDQLISCNAVAPIGLSILSENLYKDQIFYFLDTSGNASTNAITITCSTGTINGAASISINQDFGSLSLIFDGTDFFTVSSSNSGSSSSPTLSTDSGSLTSSTLPLLGRKAGVVPVVETAIDSGNAYVENRTWVTQYVVDNNVTAGLRGTFSTIQSAMDQAVIDGASLSSPKRIDVRFGLYTENLTIPPGIYLRSDAAVGSPSPVPLGTEIRGNHTMVTTNQFRAENIYFTNVDAALDMFTSSPVNILKFTNCTLNNGSSTGLFFTLNFNLQVFDNCSFFSNSFQESILLDGGSATFKNCTFVNSSGIKVSNAASLDLENCFQVGIINCDASTDITARRTFFVSSDQYNIIGNGASANFDSCTFNSTLCSSNFTGNLFFSSCVTSTCFVLSNSLSALVSGQQAGNIVFGTRVSGNYSAGGNDQHIEVDTSASNSLIIINSVSDLNRCWIISDYSGNCSVNNITIQTGSGGTINGLATLVLNTNYKSVCLKSDGTNLRILWTNGL